MSDQTQAAGDAVGNTLRLLHQALHRFVEREMRVKHGDRWEQVVLSGLSVERQAPDLDVAALLQVIEKNWNTVFVRHLSQNDRGHVSELRGVRNQWAHQRPFSMVDVLRALDTAQRLLKSIGATDEALRVSSLKTTLSPEPLPSVPSKPAQSTKARQEGHDRRAANSGDWPDELDPLASAFVRVFGPTFRTFGSEALGNLGLCDAVNGVQWNAGINLATGRATLGVNLEGMQYDGWPVARLIERELSAPSLPKLVRSRERSDDITLHWTRDCWQAAGRLKILEHSIAPTPITLDRLTADGWHLALLEARGCLDASRGYRGRGRQLITMAGSGARAEKDVSPHLHFRIPLLVVERASAWEPAIQSARSVLQPLHRWAKTVSTP